MHDNIYEFACKELDDLDRKAKNGSLSMAEMQYADILEHYRKDALAVDGMESGGYSGHYPIYGGTYSDGSSRTHGGSYAGRRNARRDSMGRYSGDGYSRDGGMVEELRELMQDAPDERTRLEFKRFIEKIENM